MFSSSPSTTHSKHSTKSVTAVLTITAAVCLLCYLFTLTHLTRSANFCSIWLSIPMNKIECLQQEGDTVYLLVSADVSDMTLLTVRLVGGVDNVHGRLEVHHEGTWGTVCGDFFNEATAKVVCNMLGHGFVFRALSSAVFCCLCVLLTHCLLFYFFPPLPFMVSLFL